MKSIAFKKEVYNHCLHILEDRMVTIHKNLDRLMDSKQNETKSSAGDKYETGMAMIQNEEDLFKRQLADTSKILEQIKKIEVSKKCTQVEPGAMVQLPAGWFYISAGMGKITVDGKDVFCISLQSPIGVAIKHKMVTDIVSFNNQKFTIKDIY
ncbi:MAG: transcription elongation factor [Nonlabens sp.]|uniref:transcription elongation factor n=1 Tax=Nonlabens sp. TaxID=1888209 RepID=UPI003EF7B144